MLMQIKEDSANIHMRKLCDRGARLNLSEGHIKCKLSLIKRLIVAVNRHCDSMKFIDLYP